MNKICELREISSLRNFPKIYNFGSENFEILEAKTKNRVSCICFDKNWQQIEPQDKLILSPEFNMC